MLKKSKVSRRVCKLMNFKIKNVTCLKKKKSKKLLNWHRNMVMQPQLGNSIKSSRLLLEVISAFGAEDTRNI